MQNSKQEFLCQSSEFEPMCVKQTRPNYSVGSYQDEAEIQYED